MPANPSPDACAPALPVDCQQVPGAAVAACLYFLSIGIEDAAR